METPVRSMRGLTALELLVVMAIAAVLAALATPGFARLHRAAALASVTDELLWALHYARSSAIRDARPVTLCLTVDDHTCLRNSGVAARGWLVFHESGGGTPARVLRSFHLPAHFEVRGTRSAVTFWPVTRAGTTSTFRLCHVRHPQQGRAVVVSRIGRPRVVQGAVSCA